MESQCLNRSLKTRTICCSQASACIGCKVYEVREAKAQTRFSSTVMCQVGSLYRAP
jgi:hypothetical protein